MGSEVEWATIVTKNGRPLVSFLGDKTATFFQHCLPEELMPPLYPANHMSIFLANGARIYLDTGYHLEYASPEAINAEELVIYEKAGERVFADMIAEANRFWGSENLKFRAFKNNLAIEYVQEDAGKVKSVESSYGSHENYLVWRNEHTMPDRLVWSFAPFLGSSILFTGNGWVCKSKDRKILYQISQRSRVMANEKNGSTTSSRSLINTRDEPHAESKTYRRLHLICRDANINEAALFLKYGTADMLLDLIEDGYLDDNPLGANWKVVDMMKKFSEDSMLETACEINGIRYSIIDIQELYRDLVEEFYTKHRDMTSVDKKILELWSRVIALAKSPRPHEGLAPYADWAAKKLLLERDLDRRGFTWGAEADSKTIRKGREENLFDHLKEFDFRYHENGPTGIARLIDSHQIAADDEIRRAMHTPQQTTRAFARAAQIRWAKTAGHEISSIDWEKTTLVNGRSFNNIDPFGWQPRINGK